MNEKISRRMLIDADGCPVVREAVDLAVRFRMECLILCDTSHHIEHTGAQTLMVSKGADCVDFALVNLLKAGDIVITQDYGLAAMCLARSAQPISQDGMEYTKDNIDALLMSRHIAKKVRESGGRLKGARKRTSKQDDSFITALTAVLQKE